MGSGDFTPIPRTSQKASQVGHLASGQARPRVASMNMPVQLACLPDLGLLRGAQLSADQKPRAAPGAGQATSSQPLSLSCSAPAQPGLTRTPLQVNLANRQTHGEARRFSSGITASVPAAPWSMVLLAALPLWSQLLSSGHTPPPRSKEAPCCCPGPGCPVLAPPLPHSTGSPFLTYWAWLLVWSLSLFDTAPISMPSPWPDQRSHTPWAGWRIVLYTKVKDTTDHQLLLQVTAARNGRLRGRYTTEAWGLPSTDTRTLQRTEHVYRDWKERPDRAISSCDSLPFPLCPVGGALSPELRTPAVPPGPQCLTASRNVSALPM